MKNILLIVVLLPLVFTACRGTKSIPERYYNLHLPAAALEELQQGLGTIPGHCHINMVSVAPAYASHQIAIREQSHTIRYFSFNEWVQRPGYVLTDLKIAFLDQHQIFETISTGRPGDEAGYLLETTVHRLEVDNRDDAFAARLVIEFDFLDANTGRRLSNHKADRSMDLPERNLNSFAAAISELFAEELRNFTSQIMQKRE